MEVFYLLGSLASTFFASSFLSLLLAIRSLFQLARFVSSPHGNEQRAHASVRIFEGRVSHSRIKPVFNSFEYPVRYALFDLDRAPHHSSLSADEARQAARTDGPVFLLTIPTSVGYEQNPLKVYYCYGLGEGGEDDRGSLPRLRNCIAEVTNTPWGEKVFFEFCPGSDMVAKPLHVSPFMDMLGNWTIHADEPGENIFICISVQHPTLGNYFTAKLNASRVHLPTASLNLEMYFWLMPHKVALWIYWQAVKLWWKNAPVIGHPKYSNPSYRDDALLRDNELCPLHINKRGNHLNQNCNGESRNRWCIWREAEWPWRDNNC